jgi:hypothetical protein
VVSGKAAIFPDIIPVRMGNAPADARQIAQPLLRRTALYDKPVCLRPLHGRTMGSTCRLCLIASCHWRVSQTFTGWGLEECNINIRSGDLRGDRFCSGLFFTFSGLFYHPANQVD